VREIVDARAAHPARCGQTNRVCGRRRARAADLEPGGVHHREQRLRGGRRIEGPAHATRERDERFVHHLRRDDGADLSCHDRLPEPQGAVVERCVRVESVHDVAGGSCWAGDQHTGGTAGPIAGPAHGSLDASSTDDRALDAPSRRYSGLGGGAPDASPLADQTAPDTSPAEASGGAAGGVAGSAGAPPACPSGSCDPGESCETCPADCGPCCPNGACDHGESCETCSADGGACVAWGNQICGGNVLLRAMFNGQHVYEKRNKCWVMCVNYTVYHLLDYVTQGCRDEGVQHCASHGGFKDVKWQPCQP
jgi:hypothetical protein